MENKKEHPVDLNKVYQLANKKIASMGDKRDPNGVVKVSIKGKIIDVPYFESKDDPNGWVFSQKK